MRQINFCPWALAKSIRRIGTSGWCLFFHQSTPKAAKPLSAYEAESRAHPQPSSSVTGGRAESEEGGADAPPWPAASCVRRLTGSPWACSSGGRVRAGGLTGARGLHGADTSQIPCGRSPHRPSAFDTCPIRSWKSVADRRRCTGRRAPCTPRHVCTWGTAGPPSPRRGSPPCNTGHRTDYRFERRPEGANSCRIDRGAGRLPPRAAAAGEAVRRPVALPEGASADWRDYPRTAEATRAQTSAHRQKTPWE